MIYMCRNCGVKLTKCTATNTVGQFSAIKKQDRAFAAKKTSELVPYVCSTCGLTEWYVKEPSIFKE